MKKDYDDLIKAACETYLPGWDWRLLKAQLFCESALNCEAESSVGARGIAQFMPATWKEVCAGIGFASNSSPDDPNKAIPAAAFYMSKLLIKWRTNRPPMDRYALALASYNAGFGNILNAQKRADGANEYSRIIAALPGVTGKAHSKETTDYVIRILSVFSRLITQGS